MTRQSSVPPSDDSDSSDNENVNSKDTSTIYPNLHLKIIHLHHQMKIPTLTLRKIKIMKKSLIILRWRWMKIQYHLLKTPKKGNVNYVNQ